MILVLVVSADSLWTGWVWTGLWLWRAKKLQVSWCLCALPCRDGSLRCRGLILTKIALFFNSSACRKEKPFVVRVHRFIFFHNFYVSNIPIQNFHSRLTKSHCPFKTLGFNYFFIYLENIVALDIQSCPIRVSDLLELTGNWGCLVWFFQFSFWGWE